MTITVTFAEQPSDDDNATESGVGEFAGTVVNFAIDASEVPLAGC